MSEHLKPRNLYGNDIVTDPEGRPMFRCRRKKSDWYLKRGLAEVVSQTPYTIRLLFKPNGLGNYYDSFYIEEKDNKCCVCGDKRTLTRHHVIPRCYRRFFAVEEKSRASHDVVLVCEDCHTEYEKHSRVLSSEIAAELGVPWDQILSRDFARFYSTRAYARTLLDKSVTIPEDRQYELLEKIEAVHPNKTLEEVARVEIDPEILARAGQLIMQKVTDRQAFAERWRQHFVDTMHPLYMSKHWDIKRPIIKQ